MRSLAIALALLLALALPVSAQPIAANNIHLVGTPSGTSPQVQATGTDTNLDVNVIPKGTGCLAVKGVCVTAGGGLSIGALVAGSVVNRWLYVDASNRLEQTVPVSLASVGVNNAGYVEVISDGADNANSGLFGTFGSTLTLHGTSASWHALMWDDADGIVNGVAQQVLGTYPTNAWGLYFGDGAGSYVNVVSISPSEFFAGDGATWGLDAQANAVQVQATNFQFGAAGSTAISSPSGSFVYFDLTGSPSSPNSYSHTFFISDGAGGSVPFIIQHDGSVSLSEMNANNNAGTAVAGVAAQIIGDPASSLQAVLTMETLDDRGDTFLNLNSQRANGDMYPSLALVTTGSNDPRFQLQPAGSHGRFSMHATAMDGDGFFDFTLPTGFPAANGQPLVATTAGVMSFAAGVTKTCGVLPTVVGGIVTAC